MELRNPLRALADRPAFRVRIRIVHSLLVVLVLAGLAPMTIAAWRLVAINKELLRRDQMQSQLSLARSIAGQLETHMGSLRSQLHRLSWLLGGVLQRQSMVDEARVERILAGMTDPRMLHVRYQDLRGGSVESGTGGRVPPGLQPLFVNGFRTTAESLADRGREPGEMVSVSPPLILEAERPRAAILLSTPVIARGAFRGVLSVLVDLDLVWESVLESTRTPNIVFVLDGEGRVFASSDRKAVAPGQDARDSELVERFLSQGGRATETLPFRAAAPEGRARFIGSYHRVRSEGWGVFAQAREDDVYAPVSEMLAETIPWALGAFALAVALAVVFAGTVSRPINRLAEASRSFAAGDFGARVTVRSRSEIGELSDTFNRMASDLEDHILRLKRAADENKNLFLGTIHALAEAIDAKDPYTRGHSTRVNRYAVVIARRLGLTRDDVREIYVSALLHDVGKIAIDDAILKKDGPLTREEFEIMKTHTVRGELIMAPIRQMKRILPGLRSHHERWVGGGYPDGLKAEAIPLMARIIAVADTFDAITTDRPYQKAMSFDAAVARILELRGQAFEPAVVDAFVHAYRDGEIGAEETPEPFLEVAEA